MAKQLTQEEKLSIIRTNGGDKEHLLAILLELQNASEQNYIDEETAALVAQELKMTMAKVFDVVTFYAMLSEKPQGKFVLEVCNNTPCYVSKSEKLAAFLQSELGIKMGETTPDGMFSLHYTPCVGACDIGPVIKIKDTVHGNLTEEKVKQLLADLKSGKCEQ